MAEEKTSGLSSGQLQIDTGASWNFGNATWTTDAERYFFREGKLQVKRANETYRGQRKGLGLAKKALLKQLKDQLKIDLKGATGAQKRAIRKTYNDKVRELNTEYKSDLAELQEDRREAVAKGKALTKERLISGYRPPVDESAELSSYTSPYAEEQAALETQNDSTVEALPTAEDLLIGLQESQAQLTELFSGSGSVDDTFIKQLEASSKAFETSVQNILTGTTTQPSTAEIDLTIKQQDENQKDLVDLADKNLSQTEAVVDKQVEQVKEAPAITKPTAPVAEEPVPTVPVEAPVEEPLKIEPASQDLITREFLDLLIAGQEAENISRQRDYDLMIARQEADDIRLDKEYDLRKEELGIRQAAIDQQERFAQEQRDAAKESYQNQLTRYRNQARMNLTPELQIQPSAQGQNIGGTSMFKRPAPRVKTSNRDELIPRDTLGITQQSATNSLNIA